MKLSSPPTLIDGLFVVPSRNFRWQIPTSVLSERSHHHSICVDLHPFLATRDPSPPLPLFPHMKLVTRALRYAVCCYLSVTGPVYTTPPFNLISSNYKRILQRVDHCDIRGIWLVERPRVYVIIVVVLTVRNQFGYVTSTLDNQVGSIYFHCPL